MCLVAQLCPTLFDPMDYSLPASSVPEILQARILEWGFIPFSRGSPNPGIEPRSPALQADSFTSEPPGKPVIEVQLIYNVMLVSGVRQSDIYTHIYLMCALNVHS